MLWWNVNAAHAILCYELLECVSASESALKALVTRLDRLKERVALEARRNEHRHHPGVKNQAALLQKQFAAHLEKIEVQIKESLAAACWDCPVILMGLERDIDT